MSEYFRGCWAVAKHETRLLRRDRLAIVINFLLPLVIMAFAVPIYSRALRAGAGAGALFAVPSMTVLFSFSTLGTVGVSFFKDFNWGTWERARAMPLTMPGLLVGKALPIMARSVTQQMLLLVCGGLLFGIPVAAGLLQLLLLSVVFSAALVALGMLITALARTNQQVSVIQSVTMIVFGGLGGVLSPSSMLPEWVRRIAPVSPGYWAATGYHRVLADHAGLPGVLPGVALLATLSCVLGVIAAMSFRAAASRLGWG
jgi:ABC-2 type transport system permease protein